jgi:hypothetical protein
VDYTATALWRAAKASVMDGSGGIISDPVFSGRYLNANDTVIINAPEPSSLGLLLAASALLARRRSVLRESLR